MIRDRLATMSWQEWLVFFAGWYCSYLLYTYLLGLSVFFRPDIVTNSEQFMERLLRTVGTVILVAGAVLVWLRRPTALWVSVFGALVYLLPWIYAYVKVVVTQPQAHLMWHMLKVYPILSWQQFLVPPVFVFVVHLAVQRVRANRSLQPTAYGRG